jgi:hypothetical protein
MSMKFPKRVGVYILAGAIACLSASPPANAAREAAPPPAIAPADGQHDFDFNIGVWKTHIKRILDPLSGSGTSIELNGTVTVRKVWDGRGELFSQETVDGRSILVRAVWSDITPNWHHFEQSYSNDGGKSWAPAFIANLSRQRQ